MPNRIVREGLPSGGRSRQRAIPLAVKRRIWAMPCAVCGCPYSIKVDHITPVAKGGGCEESNLQPLCHACNHIKHCNKDNSEVRKVVARRGLWHFLAAMHRHDIRYEHSYDAPNLHRWLGSKPDREAEALRLYLAFIGGANA